jgi:hypothetical protein
MRLRNNDHRSLFSSDAALYFVDNSLKSKLKEDTFSAYQELEF